MNILECLKCGHEWVGRREFPKKCPRCYSYYWDEPPKTKAKYKTEAQFRSRLEDILKLQIAENTWKFINDFLYGAAIHAPYSEGDIKYALPKIKRLLKLLKE